MFLRKAWEKYLLSLIRSNPSILNCFLPFATIFRKKSRFIHCLKVSMLTIKHQGSKCQWPWQQRLSSLSYPWSPWSTAVSIASAQIGLPECQWGIVLMANWCRQAQVNWSLFSNHYTWGTELWRPQDREQLQTVLRSQSLQVWLFKACVMYSDVNKFDKLKSYLSTSVSRDLETIILPCARKENNWK